MFWSLLLRLDQFGLLWHMVVLGTIALAVLYVLLLHLLLPLQDIEARYHRRRNAWFQARAAWDAAYKDAMRPEKPRIRVSSSVRRLEP